MHMFERTIWQGMAAMLTEFSNKRRDADCFSEAQSSMHYTQCSRQVCRLQENNCYAGR